MNVNEFNRSVDLFSDNIYRFILKHISDEDKAKDIVQESYIKLWDKVEEVNFEKVRSYLFSTAYHTMIDVIRKDKRMSYLDDVSQQDMYYEDEYNNAKEILNEAIKNLPEDQRAVLLLRDFEGYTYEEIGEITGLSESQVKVYIYRARVFLKKYIVRMDLVI
ncbi:MAG: RNA polymerase sigma factor [Bacteroidota bacterium]